MAVSYDNRRGVPLILRINDTLPAEINVGVRCNTHPLLKIQTEMQEFDRYQGRKFKRMFAEISHSEIEITQLSSQA